MSKSVLLVGHCGPDSSYLRMTIKKAVVDVKILSADDAGDYTKAIEGDAVDLVLFNRELGYGFEPSTGVEAIRELRLKNPNLKSMLVSNYAEAQLAAQAAGALPGFGKSELGTLRVLEVLRGALEVSEV